jgi:O-antigen/teichoic acid export membrane protein
MLFKNTAAQSADLLTAYLFSLLLAPLMLDRLGLELFGIWAVTGALAAYAGLLDLGITRSLARFVALYDVEGDRSAIGECVGLGLLAITAVAAVGAVLALVTPVFLAGSLESISAGDLRLVLLCSLAIFCFTAYRRVLNSVDVGLRRMVPPNVANVLTNVVNFAFSVAALVIHPDLVTYGAANALSYLIGMGAAIAAVRHVWGSVPVKWPSRALARQIASFSAKNQLHAVADLVNLQTDKVIIAFAVGVKAAASYEIAARVVMAARSVGLLTISAMIPTVTAHIARHGRDALSQLYRRYTTLTVALSYPVLALTCVTAPYLLHAWLGQVPERASGVVVLLTAAYLLPLSAEVAMNVAVGDGRPGLVSSNSIVTAAVNIALTVALAPLLGFWGVLAGTVLALAGGSVVFVRRFLRVYGLPWRDHLLAVGRPAALALGLTALLLPFELLLGWDTASRLLSAAVVVASVAAYALVYWPLAGRLGFLPEKLTLHALRRRPLASGER